MNTTQDRIQRYLRQLAPHQRDREAAQLLDESFKQLEAAEQRELELLAVVERLADDWDDLLEDMELRGMHKFEPYIRSKAKFKNRPEPSQALREHEANVLEELLDTFAFFQTEEGLWLANAIRGMAEERRKN